MTMSGTSMATPHVSGLIAYLIAKDGNLSPAAMETKVRNLAATGYISGLREWIHSTASVSTLTSL
jgi:cerevisin